MRGVVQRPNNVLFDDGPLPDANKSTITAVCLTIVAFAWVSSLHRPSCSPRCILRRASSGPQVPTFVQRGRKKGMGETEGKWQEGIEAVVDGEAEERGNRERRRNGRGEGNG